MRAPLRPVLAGVGTCLMPSAASRPRKSSTAKRFCSRICLLVEKTVVSETSPANDTLNSVPCRIFAREVTVRLGWLRTHNPNWIGSAPMASIRSNSRRSGRISDAAQGFEHGTRPWWGEIEFRLRLLVVSCGQAASKSVVAPGVARPMSICRLSASATARPSSGGTALPICRKAEFMAPENRNPSGKD